jgi:plasmid stabilization system protein ParE
MSLTVVLRDEAQREFDEAFDFYELKKQGLGVVFLTRVQQVFDRISNNPSMHSIVVADVRKAVVKQFPFCVFYRPHSDRIEVLAVFHTSRDPEEWRKRV